MGGICIKVEGRRLGRDFLFTVTGGDEHIGAVSTVFPDTTGEQSGWTKSTFELPGHKEGPLAEQLAELGARALNATVTVAAGIHIPNATRDDIRQAVEQSLLQFEKSLSDFIS